MQTETATNPTPGPEASSARKTTREVFEQRSPEGKNHLSGAPCATSTSSPEEIDQLVFDCERLSVYHAIRRDFLDRLQRISAFLVVLSGTAAFAAISAQWGMDWLSLVPALFGLGSLVFDFAGQARIHENLYRRLCLLRGDILADENAGHKIRHWQRIIHEIYADESSTYRALDAWAHNLACDGRGVDARYKIKIPGWHLVLKNIWPFWSADYTNTNTM